MSVKAVWLFTGRFPGLTLAKKLVGGVELSLNSGSVRPVI